MVVPTDALDVAGEIVRIGSVVVDRYEIQAVIGEGGIGITYQALDRQRQETVVFKAIRPDLGGAAPEADPALRAEIKLARRVQHPNVGRVYEYGTHGRLRYIVSELVSGAPLGPAGEESTLDACRLALQICDGLDAIHSAGLVHGALKPPNIMVDEQGLARLLDFGIVPLLANAASSHSWGTRAYMSPEQQSGQMVDPRSDIYALGLLLFERITGRLPGAASLEARVPGPLLPVLHRALAQRAEDRFPTAPAMATEIRRAMERLRSEPAAAPDTASATALARLLVDLRDGSADLRWRATLGLVALGSAAAGAVDPLITALRDDDGPVRSGAANALVNIGRAAVPALLDAMAGPFPNTRYLAAEALTRMGMASRPPPAAAVPEERRRKPGS
jgi:eukaryotic-like serine/threonine-protein kinase